MRLSIATSNAASDAHSTIRHGEHEGTAQHTSDRGGIQLVTVEKGTSGEVNRAHTEEVAEIGDRKDGELRDVVVDGNRFSADVRTAEDRSKEAESPVSTADRDVFTQSSEGEYKGGAGLQG